MTSLTIRSSSMGKLFDCALRFEAENINGLRKPSGRRAALGTAVHASTAAFDQGRIEGASLKPDDVAGVLVDTLKNPGYDVDTEQDDLTVEKAEVIGLKLHTQYCLDWSPRYQFTAVELETKPMDIDCGEGTVIRLTGTLDRSRLVAGTDGVRIADLKSGARAVEKGEAKTKGHAAQVGIYEMLYEHTTGQAITAPAEIIGLQTSGTPKIATGQIAGAKEMLVGTPEFPGLIQYAAQMFRTGMFPPNPQSMLCSEKYCAFWNRCPYHR